MTSLMFMLVLVPETRLEHIDRELVGHLAGDDLVGRLADGVGDRVPERRRDHWLTAALSALIIASASIISAGLDRPTPGSSRSPSGSVLPTVRVGR